MLFNLRNVKSNAKEVTYEFQDSKINVSTRMLFEKAVDTVEIELIIVSVEWL